MKAMVLETAVNSCSSVVSSVIRVYSFLQNILSYVPEWLCNAHSFIPGPPVEYFVMNNAFNVERMEILKEMIT